MAWSVHQWRGYFATAPDNASVLDILHQAITVAAVDSPQEFNRRKTQILNSIEEATANVGTKILADSVAPVRDVENPPRTPRVIRIKLPQWYLDQEKEPKKPPCSVASVGVDQNHQMVKAKKAVSDEEAKLEANVGAKCLGDSTAPVRNENPPRTSCVIRIKLPKGSPNQEKEPEKPPCPVASVLVEQTHQTVNPKPKPNPVMDDEAKLEATKRKLQKRYEEIEKNKKQKRVVQLGHYVPENNKLKVAMNSVAAATKQGGKKGGNQYRRKMGSTGMQLNRLVNC